MFFEKYKEGTLCPREFAKFSYEPLTKYSYKTLLNIREKFFDDLRTKKALGYIVRLGLREHRD